MTVSITPCSANALPEPLWFGMPRAVARLVCGFVLFCSLFISQAFAGVIEPTRAALVSTEDGYALSADFNVDLGPRVEEAVTKGLALYFNLEFELTRSRWYWPNEHMAGHTLTYRLSYTPLTRQFRLATGALHRNFDSLGEALRALSRVSALPVLDKNALKPGDNYTAAVRLSLDRNQLPKPFQLEVFANKDWDIPAKVLRWQPQAGGDTK